MEYVSVIMKCVTETGRSVPFRPFREIVRNVHQKPPRNSVKIFKFATEASVVFVPISSVLKEGSVKSMEEETPNV